MAEIALEAPRVLEQPQAVIGSWDLRPVTRRSHHDLKGGLGIGVQAIEARFGFREASGAGLRKTGCS
jgi:hypothetical protein